jgi:cell wall-associated NlpC family hydrolase
VLLPRDAYLQSRSPLGDLLPEGAAFQPGDLIFFCGDRDPRGRGITHVGMAYDANHFIHASGKEGVAVTPFSDSYARRTFRCAWRYRIPTS